LPEVAVNVGLVQSVVKVAHEVHSEEAAWVGGGFMSNFKFSRRELLFLEFFFSGCSLKDSAKAAGYKGASASALCNTARKILTKYEKSASAKGIFRGARASEGRIVTLLGDMAMNHQCESKKLKYLSILSRAMFSKG